MNNIIMHDPDLTKILAEMYFGIEEHIPTVPGLALHLGFNRTSDITKALEKWERDESTYPEQSVIVLLKSLTMIEDHYVTKGLMGSFPAALVKFTMNVYHGLVEKKQYDQTPDTAIQIVFQAPSELPTAPRFQIEPEEQDLLPGG